MRNSVLLLWLAAFALKGGAAAPSEKTVFVRNNELFVAEDSSQPQPITHDGIPKALPVWSKSGSRIAFIRETDHKRALAQLVVVDQSGLQTANVLLRPVEKAPPEGMRFVENVQWVSSDKIGVGGSVNPSQTETVVIDLKSGQEVNDIYDDGGGPVFSPDGSHYAYEGGMPHFAPAATWRPTLSVDDQVVFPQPGAHVVFLTEPRWSDQSDDLAVVVADHPSNETSLVVWRASGSISVIPLKVVSGELVDLFWTSGTFYVTSPNRAWRFQGSSLAQLPEKSVVNPLTQARIEQNARRARVGEAGDRDLDVWCQNCSLAALPRRQTSNK